MKKILIVFLLLITSITAYAQMQGLENFKIRVLQKQEFYKFIKVFSEIRGPLRVQILKDSKTSFENADPLKYVTSIKDEADVQKALQQNGLTWDQFTELFGNVVIGYFSIQSNETKASLVKRMAGYGLIAAGDQMPEGSEQLIKDFISTDEGASIAAMAVEMLIQIPPENTALAKEKKRSLDQLFYTRFWKDKV